MTSPTSAAINRPARAASIAVRRGRRAFTIVELLVVIGIMGALAALLLPMVMRAYGVASRTRLAYDLQAIAGALEAYKQDHGAYPPVRMQTGIATAADRPNPPTGAQILCLALIGPAPALEPGTGNNRRKQDGLDGPGFRLRAGGKPYPPYLKPDTFKFGVPGTEPLDTTAANVLLFCLLDRNQQPILYFPASPTKPNVRVASVPAPYLSQSEVSRYDVLDNAAAIDPAVAEAEKKMRLLLGDRDVNGVIDVEDTAVDLPFLLWSAGPDDLFGPKADAARPTATLDFADVRKCDDVTNFRQ